jgi:hypothetical protein
MTTTPTTVEETWERIATLHPRVVHHNGYYVTVKVPPEYGRPAGEEWAHDMGTIDGIASLWPKNWKLRIEWLPDYSLWTGEAFFPSTTDSFFVDSPTELEARTKLLLAILEHEAATKERT